MIIFCAIEYDIRPIMQSKMGHLFQKLENDFEMSETETESNSDLQEELDYISDEEYNENYSFIKKKETVQFKKPNKKVETNIKLLSLEEEDYIQE